MVVYLYKREMVFLCVHVLIYSACTMPGEWKASGACTSLSPKYIKGTVFTAHTACLSMSPVHQSGMAKGKGTERMLMLLSPCCVDLVMGLEGCVGVHSTSRPPQKDLSFPQLPLIVGLRYVGIGLHTSFFTCIVALLVEG